jgi:hypothetical protein
MNDETLEELYLPFLRNTRARIDTPDKWTRDVMARDKDGDQVRAKDPTACKFCVEGAAEREAREVTGLTRFAPRRFDLQRSLEGAFCVTAKRLGLSHAGQGTAPSDYNDHGDNTHADILRVLDTMIAETEAHL